MHFVRQQTALRDRLDSRSSLRAINCPALVVEKPEAVKEALKKWMQQ
jgi:hypothetical protein